MTQDASSQDLNDALEEACCKGDIAKVKHLVAQGVDINRKDEWGFSPLMGALIYNHENCLIFLLEEGADTFWQSRRSRIRTP